MGRAIGSIIRSPPRCAASCAALAHGRSYVCYSRPGAADRIGRGLRRRRATCRASVFDAGRRPARRRRLPLRADALHGGDEGGARGARRRAGADSRRALQRQRVADPRRGRRGDARAAPARRTTPTPARWCRSRAAASPRTGTPSAYQSVLELAEACDVPVRWSCRTGVCHNCESGLVSGEVVYGPEPLDQPAEGNLLVCCARPRGDVVIDL